MSPGQDAPAVSVIIATYNSSATLKLALQSLLQQDFTDFEAWVVGDGCTDDSEKVVASCGDPRLHWTNLPHNFGNPGAPNNEGLRRARGRYIAYLGHDDLWFPWHISELVASIQESDADLVHSLVARLGPSGITQVSGRPLSTGRTYGNHGVPASSWLHRREVTDNCGWWEEDYTRLSRPVDSDYLRRIYLAGKRIAFCPQLSVLKFPSSLFGLYALTKDYPQMPYFQALQNDPEKLLRQLLLELVLLPTRQSEPRKAVFRAFRYAFRSVGGWLLDAYGQERWPLASVLYWRFQRSRKQKRRVRGLAPEPHARGRNR